MCLQLQMSESCGGSQGTIKDQNTYQLPLQKLQSEAATKSVL